MEMTPQTLVVVNGLIVTLVVLSFFLIRRGPRPPVKLDLTSGAGSGTGSGTGGRANSSQRTKPATKPATNAATKPESHSSTKTAPAAGWGNYRPRPGPRRIPADIDSEIDSDADTSAGKTAPEISLNALYNWNGHTFDAYEVLGIPAGSSRDNVVAAYQRAIARADKESLPFLKAAFEAIARS